MSVKGGIIKGCGKDGVCHSLGILVTTSESAAVWAWAFSVLNGASLDLGGPGVLATALLHDCVPTTFYALASVLPSLQFHHYCSWHSITRFSEHLPGVYSCKEDLVEPDLVADVAANRISVSAALVRQREIVLHSFNAALLARHERDAAVLLVGFHHKYCANIKLIKLLSRDPYNDLSAMLLCWSAGARAIDAECELFARAVRAFQATAQGGRIKMRNFAGAFLLVVRTLFYCARSEYRESLRASSSLGARTPLLLLSPIPASPLPTVAGGGQHLGLLPLASSCATLSSLPLLQLHNIPSREVSASVQTMAHCLPAEDFGWRLRLAAHCGVTGAFTFEALHRTLCSEPSFIVPRSCLASYADAMAAACKNAELALQAQAQACEQPLVMGEDECMDAPTHPLGAPSHPPAPTVAFAAATSDECMDAPTHALGAPSHPPAPTSASATATSIAGAAFHLFAQQTFGSARMLGARPQVPYSARVYSLGLLPLLPPHRGCGRAHDAERLQWATVTGYGDDRVAISLPNQLRILQALRELPKDVKVHYLVPRNLCERKSGAAHGSAKEASALSAPKKRALCVLSLIASAMENVYGAEPKLNF